MLFRSAEHDLRLHAHEVALHFKARFSLDGDCADLPAETGETPIDGEFVKERCEKEANGARIVSEARFYFRPGQQLRDPNTGLPMANAFESSARLEVLWTTAANEVPAWPAQAKHPGREDEFLFGYRTDCVRCDLAGADLRYRDLSGADLTGANLEKALLHRARLRGANLEGARLDGANLNRATLAAATLKGASLQEAMLYQADAQSADLDRKSTRLNSSHVSESRMPSSA